MNQGAVTQMQVGSRLAGGSLKRQLGMNSLLNTHESMKSMQSMDVCTLYSVVGTDHRAMLGIWTEKRLCRILRTMYD